MTTFLTFSLLGSFTGAAYAIMASGLVLTYATTRVFNIAHGAFGMLLAFTFWDFTVGHGVPIVPALAVVLLVIAPLMGWFVQRFVTRGLGEAPAAVPLVVTVGMLVALIGVSQYVWKSEFRILPPFYPDRSWQVGEVFVTAHQLIMLACSIVVALSLWLLLNRTRIGMAMRASVDDPELLSLFGGRPDTVAALAWAVGIALAALGGILLTPDVGLDPFALTLLVINAYAAAMLGRLKSLPWTFVGAMVLGILQSLAVAYLPLEGFWATVRPVIPAFFLFLIVTLMPQARLRVGQIKGIVSAPVPSSMKSFGWGGGLLVGALVLIGIVSAPDVLLIGTAATYAMVMLSLVLLTGYGGYVSLAQFTFAGVGALVYCRVDEPNLLGLAMSGLVAAAVGVLVAFSVLRLTGLYLALATMAFGVIMEKLIFQAEFAFKYNGTLSAERMSLFGIRIGKDTEYVWMMVLALVLMAFFVLFLRRGSLGRLLIAMRDSPTACGTLGLNMRWFRVGLFALSAGIAGIAGGLFAGMRGTVGAADFVYFQSLLILLLAVVFGVTSVTGAVMGGTALMLLPVWQSSNPELAGLLFVVLGVGAVALCRDPNGVANHLFTFGRWSLARITPRVEERLAGLLPKGGSVASRTDGRPTPVRWADEQDAAGAVSDPLPAEERRPIDRRAWGVDAADSETTTVMPKVVH